MIFGTLNLEKIWHQQLVHLPTSPVYYSHFTLGNPKKVIFNSIIHTYFRLFASSQKKTNCYSLTHHTWKMSLVKYTTFSSFSFLLVSSTNARHGRVAEASCCHMGWISAERGGRCSWSVAKKTGTMYPRRRWSLWTFAVTLLAGHSICHTSQLFFQTHQCQPS